VKKRVKAKEGLEAPIEKKVKQIIADQFGLKVKDIKRDDAFAEDIMAESLDIVELIAALEEEFDIEIPDEEAEKNVTVGQAIGYIINKVKLRRTKH